MASNEGALKPEVHYIFEDSDTGNDIDLDDDCTYRVTETLLDKGPNGELVFTVRVQLCSFYGAAGQIEDGLQP